MIARWIIFTAFLTAAPAVAAEPPKPANEAPSQPSSRPLVLASAEAVKPASAGADQQTPAKRPRVARVTTCRCGDPAPSETDDQE